MHQISDRSEQFLIATHSSEIINAAEGDDILIVNPGYASAKRVTDSETLQSAMDYIGSSQNIELARLSRSKRIIFFEGQDWRVVRRFAARVGAPHLIDDVDTARLPLGGYSSWTGIENTLWTFKEILRSDVRIFALFDRDYRCIEEVDQFREKLGSLGVECHVLARKELENYLLDIPAITSGIHQRRMERGLPVAPDLESWVRGALETICEGMRTDVSGQLVGHGVRFFMQNRGKCVLD